MRTVTLLQGSDEWHAHRATHFNASDAPAMMGCSPYKSRAQLVKEYALGIRQEADSSTQRLFDDGHRFEALARPLAEGIIGEELFPTVGEAGEYSASFDGITMAGDVIWEHKTANKKIRASLNEDIPSLPDQYRVQMEHQLMVSGAAKCLFMATSWAKDGTLLEEMHCWYLPDMDLRKRIVAGWEQFKADVDSYVHAEESPSITGDVVQDLPAVIVEVSGAIDIRDNFQIFERRLRDFLDHDLVVEPETDQDFANLENQVKALRKAEDALQAAEAGALAQIATVDAFRRQKDMLFKLTRDNRLMAEKLIRSKKDEKRARLIQAGRVELNDYIREMNALIGQPYMPDIQADFAGAMKGKKTMTGLQDAVDKVLANAKIEAKAIADLIRSNLDHFERVASDHRSIFPDLGQIITKSNDDFEAVVKMRIQEAQKEAALRERIAAEEKTNGPHKEEEVATQESVSHTTRPSDFELVAVIAHHYHISMETAWDWIKSITH